FAPRPKADVGPEVATVAAAAAAPVPANIPFGTAAPAPADIPFVTAASVPANEDAGDEQQLPLGIPPPTWRPDLAVAKPQEDTAMPAVLTALTQAPVEAAQSITLTAPVPQRRPATAAAAPEAEFAVAGLPVAASSLEAELRESKARRAMLST